MFVLSQRNQIILTVLLVMLMIVTRGHHFSTIHSLPSASWAIFFIAGFYLSSKKIFALFIAEAALLDYIAINWEGVSSFCVSPAYVFLLPAFGALFLSGRWYAKRYQLSWTTLLPLSASLVFGTVASELLSSGSFYFLSGRFQETTLVEFGHRLALYFPHQVTNMAFYIGLTIALHVFVVMLKGAEQQRQTHS